MRAAAGDKKQSNRSAVSQSAAVTDRPRDRASAVTITNYQPSRRGCMHPLLGGSKYRT